MLSPETVQIAFVVVLAVVAAGGIFVVMEIYHSNGKRSARALMHDAEDSIVFLFDDQDLVDTTPAAQAMIRGKQGAGTDWDEFVRVFGPHFPHLRQRLAGLADVGTLTLTSLENSSARLDAEYWDGLVRLTFRDSARVRTTTSVDAIAIAALEDEVSTLRSLGEDAPMLIWKEDAEGRIVWANRAYLTLADQFSAGPSKAAIWPPVRIFDDAEQPSDIAPRLSRRLPAQPPGRAEPHWFEVTSVLRDGAVLHFAADADAVVRAEETRRSFVQTLGKTFAELSIGLAIFDRKRRLMTFNPALTDLTGLPFDFLSSRPQIHTVLDRLRESRILPEPKNYVSWREEIAALESQAKNGTYCENWDLPNGQTFRVTGRPHPDGAVAFLFEDISAEVSLTRRFRAEIETARGVLDGLDQAVAVFSQSGSLILSNAAYARLWGLPDDHDTALRSVSTIEATRLWQDKCAPTLIWARMREFASGFGDRTPFDEVLILSDGRSVACHVGPLPGGSTLVTFRVDQREAGLRSARVAKQSLSLTA